MGILVYYSVCVESVLLEFKHSNSFPHNDHCMNPKQPVVCIDAAQCEALTDSVWIQVTADVQIIPSSHVTKVCLHDFDAD